MIVNNADKKKMRNEIKKRRKGVKGKFCSIFLVIFLFGVITLKV